MDKILYRPEDFDMTKQFIDVVSMCYAYDMNSGSDWISRFKDFGFEAPKRR